MPTQQRRSRRHTQIAIFTNALSYQDKGPLRTESNSVDMSSWPVLDVHDCELHGYRNPSELMNCCCNWCAGDPLTDFCFRELTTKAGSNFSIHPRCFRKYFKLSLHFFFFFFFVRASERFQSLATQIKHVPQAGNACLRYSACRAARTYDKPRRGDSLSMILPWPPRLSGPSNPGTMRTSLMEPVESSRPVDLTPAPFSSAQRRLVL